MPSRPFLACSLRLLAACASLATPASWSQEPGSRDFAKVEQGRYMAAAADCRPCHTNGNGAPFAGGRSIPTPFGEVVSANITPDQASGIGHWTDEQFVAAVREGKHPDGSHLYPAMPYPYYRKMSRDDVLAIRAYLNTFPAVANEVKSNRLPFPFNIRASVGLWNALYFSDEDFSVDPQRSAVWNRGAYLVQGPGHCAGCHTPKGTLGGDKSHDALQGYSLQGWFAPNLTDDKALGLGEWSESDITSYLRSGHNRIAGASGPMSEVVSNSTAFLDDRDLAAIATYLKSNQAQSPARQPLAASNAEMTAGAAIYQDVCSACHQLDGKGVPYLIPDLADASSVASREPTSVIRVLLHGSQSVATATEPTGASMPAFGHQLSDAQIAAVATYLRNSWGHAAEAVSASDVSKARKAARG